MRSTVQMIKCSWTAFAKSPLVSRITVTVTSWRTSFFRRGSHRVHWTTWKNTSPMPKSECCEMNDHTKHFLLTFVFEELTLISLLSLDADVWKRFLSRPALPFILRLLRGLATQHPPTQVLNTVILLVQWNGMETECAKASHLTWCPVIHCPGSDRYRFNNQLAQAGAGIQWRGHWHASWESSGGSEGAQWCQLEDRSSSQGDQSWEEAHGDGHEAEGSGNTGHDGAVDLNFSSQIITKSLCFSSSKFIFKSSLICLFGRPMRRVRWWRRRHCWSRWRSW